MTTDKSQPTGWVVVSFKYASEAFYDDNAEYHGGGGSIFSSIQPFKTAEDAEIYRSGAEEVHPWPLPASVLARLKERHPTVDWSQVPVADAPKPGRWVIHALIGGCEPYLDRDGWREAAECANPWPTRAGAEAFMREVNWSLDSFVPVNLDDLPAPAVAEPSEVEKLRKENAYWMEECYHQQAKAERLQAEVDRLTRERDELREELSRCKQAHSVAEDDVESLREQLGKATLSRLDRYAMAALPAVWASGGEDRTFAKIAKDALDFAQATIRALDGAGGA